VSSREAVVKPGHSSTYCLGMLATAVDQRQGKDHCARMSVPQAAGRRGCGVILYTRDQEGL
jgi:hypothetical protein